MADDFEWPCPEPPRVERFADSVPAPTPPHAAKRRPIPPPDKRTHPLSAGRSYPPPKLVYLCQDEILRQVRIHHKTVIAIGGSHKLPPPQRQQVILLHQTPYFLGTYPIAFPLHQYRHPPVPIKRCASACRWMASRNAISASHGSCCSHCR